MCLLISHIIFLQEFNFYKDLKIVSLTQQKLTGKSLRFMEENVMTLLQINTERIHQSLRNTPVSRPPF